MLIRFQCHPHVSRSTRQNFVRRFSFSLFCSFFLSFFLSFFFLSFFLSSFLPSFLPSFLIFALFLARCTFERQKVHNTQDLTERPDHTGLCKVDLKGNKPSVPIRSPPTREAWSAPPVNHGKQNSTSPHQRKNTKSYHS